MESGENHLILIVGADVILTSDASTARSIEKSLKESTSLSREIDKYMDVWSFTQSMRGGPSGTTVGEGSASSRKRQKTAAGIANLILSIEDDGSPIGELHHKKRRDYDEPSVEITPITTDPATISSLPISPDNSPPPPRPTTDDIFRAIIDHGPLVVP